VNKRDYAAEPPQWGRRKTKEYKAPTPQEVTRSWYNALERICQTPSAGSERIEDWPTADKLPKAYHF
jgi:hypothetical protein